MEKLDLKKQYKALYNPPSTQVVMADVPRLQFLMIDSRGDPNTSVEFQQAIEALYGVAYTLKFMMKLEKELLDYPVMGLEGLWWAQDMEAFCRGDKSDWLCTLMIMQPEAIVQEYVTEAQEKVREKKNPPALDKLRLEWFEEGKCAQIMHRGPYAEEGPTVAKLHEFIAAGGLRLRGKHHEVYLTDPRRCKPQNMKTVLRQPVE